MADWGGSGLDPKDLKPYSIDDPLGEKHQREVKKRKARERARGLAPEQSIGKVIAVKPAPVTKKAARRAQRVAPPAPSQLSGRRARPAKDAKDKKGCGCLGAFLGVGCLLPFIGIIMSFGIAIFTLAPVIVEMVQVMAMEASGDSQLLDAEVYSVEATDTKFNEEVVWNIELGATLPDGTVHHASISRPLSGQDSRVLRETRKVVVRLDPRDPDVMALEEIGKLVADLDSEIEAEIEAAEQEVERAAQEQPAGSPRQPALSSPPKSAPPPKPAVVRGSPEYVAARLSAAPSSCQAVYKCCMVVQGSRAGSTCLEFLEPPVNTQACQGSLQLFQEVAAGFGKSCD